MCMHLYVPGAVQRAQILFKSMDIKEVQVCKRAIWHDVLVDVICAW